jgi:hypothetical protein
MAWWLVTIRNGALSNLMACPCRCWAKRFGFSETRWGVTFLWRTSWWEEVLIGHGCTGDHTDVINKTKLVICNYTDDNIICLFDITWHDIRLGQYDVWCNHPYIIYDAKWICYVTWIYILVYTYVHLDTNIYEMCMMSMKKHANRLGMSQNGPGYTRFCLSYFVWQPMVGILYLSMNHPVL